MSKHFFNSLYFILLTFLIVNFSACSKTDPSPAPPPTSSDPCTGKTIVITATPTSETPCTGNGAINVTASGSTGFSFKLNSAGTYQASGTFANLAAGNFTIFAKDAAGCERSVSVTVGTSGTAGPQFTAVKSLVATNCQGCHNNAIVNGGMNFEVECNIIINKARIKVRAVDEGTMPQTGPLTQAQKNIISTWINGGGGFNN